MLEKAMGRNHNPAGYPITQSVLLPLSSILRLGQKTHRDRQGGQVHSYFLTVVLRLAPHRSASCRPRGDAKMILRQLLMKRAPAISIFIQPTVTSSSSPRQIGGPREIIDCYLPYSTPHQSASMEDTATQ